MRIVFSKRSLAGLCAALISLDAIAAADPQVAVATPAAASAVTKMESSNGPWVLYAPRFSGDTVLLDAKGQEAHLWTGGATGAQSVRLQSDGSILRLAGMAVLPPTFARARIAGGRLQRFSWDGSLLWDFPAATSDFMAYGDAMVLPNGNVLAAVLEFKTREECEKAGRDPSLLTERGMFVPGLIEVRPKDKHAAFVVWKWSLWDHLYQSRHPALANYQASGRKAGRVDLGLLPNATGPAWLAPKEIDYLPEEDLVLMVMPGGGEVWVIDHGTTTAEAAGQEGGKRKRGGSIVSFAAPSLGQEGSTKDRVTAAEWRKRQRGAVDGSAELVTLRNSKEGKFVDVVQLKLDSMEFSTVRTLRHEVPVDGDNRSEPSSITVSLGESEQTLVLGSPHVGRLKFSGASPVDNWVHENKRGTVTAVSRQGKGGEACCGDAAAQGPVPAATVTGKQRSQPQPVNLQIAPITKPRAYTAGVPVKIP